MPQGGTIQRTGRRRGDVEGLGNQRVGESRLNHLDIPTSNSCRYNMRMETNLTQHSQLKSVGSN